MEKNNGSAVQTGGQVENPTPIDKNISVNQQKIKELLGNSSDVKIREFEFGRSTRRKALVLFIDGLADSDIVNHQIIEPIMYSDRMGSRFTRENTGSLQGILETLVAIGEVKESDTLDQAVQGCLSGDTALFIDGEEICFILGSKGFEKRSIEQPDTEVRRLFGR